MTPSPLDLAQRLAHSDDAVRHAAEAELASLPDGLMAAMTLRAWADYPALVRRGIRQMAAIAVAAGALAGVLAVAVFFLPERWMPEWLRAVAAVVMAIAGLVAAWFVTVGLFVAAVMGPHPRERSFRPLLLRLDDVRLVPLWLASVADAVLSERAALLLKLAKWLPRWHETETPLPDAARRDLAREMARCCEHGKLSDAEAAFLTAALVALDADPARGIPPDDALHRQAAQLTRTPGRVGEAAADALQRLGPP